MRDARLSKLLHDLHIYPDSREATDAEHIWQAAYAAGMERAAEIFDQMSNRMLEADECADAIRAEIKETT